MSDQVLEKLEEMNKEMNSKLDTLLQWKAVHQESHKTIDRDIVEVRDTLFDNPGGLKSQVQTLMNSKRNVFQWRKFWMGTLQLVVVATIIAVLGWFMFLYKKGGSSNEIEPHQHQLETKILNHNEGEPK